MAVSSPEERECRDIKQKQALESDRLGEPL